MSNLAASGYVRSNVNTLVGFHGNVVNLPQNSESFLPSPDPSYISNDLFGNEIGFFNPTPFQTDSFPTTLEIGSLIPITLDSSGYFPMEFDIPLPMVDVIDQTTPLENAPIGPAGFPNLGDIGTWDQGPLSAINDSFLSNTG